MQVTAENTSRYFEAFWDSEVPRVGEKDAPTWRGWFDAIQAGQEPEYEGFQPRKQEDFSSDAIDNWLIKEDLRPLDESLPQRAVEEGSEDIHSVVLFDDIQNLLFDVSDENLLKTLMYTG